MNCKQGALACTIAAFALAGAATDASAHAISIGFENAGPGSVNIWLGTYGHGGHHLEGSLKLEGLAPLVFGPVTTPFTMLTGDGPAFKPAGLVDGVTNFFVQFGGGPNSLPLVGTEANWLAGFPTLPVNHWQGVNFSGLAAGVYQFTWIPALGPSAEWSPWSDAMNGQFDLSGVVQPPGVPEPVSLLLFGTAFAGMAARRYRQRA